MKKLFLAVWVISLLVPALASAQPFPVNDAGVTMGHWHLNSRDIEANKKIFVAMGGTAIKTGNFEIVKFPGVAGLSEPERRRAAGDRRHGRQRREPCRLHRAEHAGGGREVEGRGRAGGAGRPGADGPGVRQDARRLADRDPREQGSEVPDPASPHPLLRRGVRDSEDPGVVRETFGAKPGMRGTNVAADLPGAICRSRKRTRRRSRRKDACSITSASTSRTWKRS